MLLKCRFIRTIKPDIIVTKNNDDYSNQDGDRLSLSDAPTAVVRFQADAARRRNHLRRGQPRHQGQRTIAGP